MRKVKLRLDRPEMEMLYGLMTGIMKRGIAVKRGAQLGQEITLAAAEDFSQLFAPHIINPFPRCKTFKFSILHAHILRYILLHFPRNGGSFEDHLSNFILIKLDSRL